MTSAAPCPARNNVQRPKPHPRSSNRSHGFAWKYERHCSMASEGGASNQDGGMVAKMRCHMARSLSLYSSSTMPCLSVQHGAKLQGPRLRAIGDLVSFSALLDGAFSSVIRFRAGIPVQQVYEPTVTNERQAEQELK